MLNSLCFLLVNRKISLIMKKKMKMRWKMTTTLLMKMMMMLMKRKGNICNVKNVFLDIRIASKNYLELASSMPAFCFIT